MRAAELRCADNDFGHDKVSALVGEIRSQLGLKESDRTVEYKVRGFGDLEPVIRVNADNGTELESFIGWVAAMLPSESERWKIEYFVVP